MFYINIKIIIIIFFCMIYLIISFPFSLGNPGIEQTSEICRGLSEK